LSDIPPTPEETLFAAAEQGRRAGLQHVYVYNDKGCDCAGENRPVEFYLNAPAEAVHQVKKCSASCCGEEGILLKKYEQKVNL
jgi:pyruvate formate lyase activating enzyme